MPTPLDEARGAPQSYTMTFNIPADGVAIGTEAGAEAEVEAGAEAINHPSHYHPDSIEAIDVIEAWGLGFHLGNVVKYIARAGLKSNDELEDLKKAQWYLERYINTISNNVKEN